MNHTAMNNLIWTTNSQSFSYFQNLKVCRTMFDFCVHALLIIRLFLSPITTRNVTAGRTTVKPEYALLVIFPDKVIAKFNTMEWSVYNITEGHYGVMASLYTPKLELDRGMQTRRGWTFDVEKSNIYYFKGI